eukprot:Partr_v1_DN24521_c0_g1_i2_m19631 putative COP9 (constitutive photomorphogenic) homolog, subunit
MKQQQLIEQYVILAKQARGLSAVDLIVKATESPHIYAFGELLRSPGIQTINGDSTHGKYYSLLELFGYGTVIDYNESKYPALSPLQMRKLQLLSLVSILSDRQSCPYAVAMESVQCPTVRQLEELVVEAVYAGVLKAQLDHRAQLIEVEWVTGRDVRSMDGGVEVLRAWQANVRELRAMLQSQLANDSRPKEGECSREILTTIKLTELLAASRAPVGTDQMDTGR